MAIESVGTPIAYRGAVASEGYLAHVRQARATVDLSQATSATISVLQANGVEVTWSPVTLINPVGQAGGYGSSVDVAYVYGGSELLVLGEYTIVIYLTGPWGTVRTKPAALDVRDKYGRRQAS